MKVVVVVVRISLSTQVNYIKLRKLSLRLPFGEYFTRIRRSVALKNVVNMVLPS